ncbi:MAG: DUF4387 family protein [Litoreibacter sp.]
MVKLGDIIPKIRSKNAGPFWLTVDLFCGDARTFDRVRDSLTTASVARLFDTDTQTLKRFDIRDLHVIKFSFPRPTVQGAIDDRDMHGASWAALLADLDLPH